MSETEPASPPVAAFGGLPDAPTATTAEQAAPPGQSALSLSAGLQLTGINLLWGASSVAAKSALTAVGPFTLGVLRFLPAGLLLFALARAGGRRVVYRRADWPALFFLGFVGITLTYGIFYIGVDRTTATDSSLLFACEPILLALFARIFLHERLSRRQWSGLLIGLIGIRLIAGQTLGNLIVLLALCFESTTGIVGKRLAARYPGLAIVSVEMIVGSLLLLPFALSEVASHHPVFTLPAVSAVLYLSLICSALCYGIWYRLLNRFPVSAMGVFILIQPLTGPLYGRLLRGETLGPAGALGGALVMVGILLTTLTERRKALTP